MDVLLVSTFDLARQPFGLASPAAWLRARGASVRTLDLSVETLDEEAVRGAGLVAFFLPMHTATRLAQKAIPRVRALNPDAALCGFGLYAPANEKELRSLGVEAVFGGEFEESLVAFVERLGAKGTARARAPSQEEPVVSTSRLEHIVPDRSTLPPLEKYARLVVPGGKEKIVGYTEASRGCKHLCRHCPVVPVYRGVFRVVDARVVLEDVRELVAAGAEHVTFGDPDFFNGPGHAMRIVRALCERFPEVSYDVTIKVEHLLAHADLLPELARTGCAFVTTAAESFDDEVLARLAKGHSAADFARAVELCEEAGLVLAPTFVPFTPWTTLEGYVEMLASIRRLGLVASVAPVQLTIRLLVPAGSLLLELPEVRQLVGPFDAERLSWRWSNPDPRVDELQRRVETLVASSRGAPREAVFARIEQIARAAAGHAVLEEAVRDDRASIPYLTEPWYC